MSTRGPRAVLTSNGAWPHQRQRAVVDEVTRFGQQRAMQRDEVRFAAQRIEVHEFDAEVGRHRRIDERIGRDQAQSPAGHLPRDRPADPSETDDPERATPHPVDHLAAPHVPAARPEPPAGLRDVAQAGQQQRDRVRRHLVRAVRRHVADHDAEVGRRIDVDVVRADSVADDDAAAPEAPEKLARHLEAAAEDAVGALAQAERLLERHRVGVDELTASRLDHLALVARGGVAVFDQDDREASHTCRFYTGSRDPGSSRPERRGRRGRSRPGTFSVKM